MIGKAILLAFAGTLSAAMLILQQPTLTTATLVVISIWAFARTYYFAFYVIGRYIDPTFKFSGLLSAARFLWSHRRTADRSSDASR